MVGDKFFATQVLGGEFAAVSRLTLLETYGLLPIGKLWLFDISCFRWKEQNQITDYQKPSRRLDTLLKNFWE